MILAILPAVASAFSALAAAAITVFNYSVEPTEPFMNGNLPRMGASKDFFFESPREVSDCDRIVFEAHGMHVDDRHHAWAAEIRPVIEDEEGERFELMPQLVKMIVSADPRYRGSAKELVPGSWCRYTTGNWYAGEAGAASHGLYTVSGKAGDKRPTGRLRFLGFRLHAVRDASPDASDPKATLTGEIRVANVTPVGGEMPFSYPFLFADNLCRKAGRYRFTATVTDDFQSDPVGGVDEEFDFTPGERRLLEIPTGKDGVHWITWSLAEAGGAELAAGRFRTQTRGAPAERLNARPRQGLGVKGGNRGVYGPDEPFEMKVTGGEGGRVEYVLEPYCSRDELAKGEVPRDGLLRFEPTAGVGVYRLKLARLAAGKTVESAEFLFGRADAAPHSRPGRLVTAAELKEKPYNRLTYHLSVKHRGRHDLAWQLADFERLVRETRAWNQNYTVSVDLADFEPLEGVYDFTLLDRFLDAAADWGVKLTVKLDHADWYAGQYRWQKFSYQYSFDGTVCGQDNPCGVFASTDRSLVDFFIAANRALYDRYRDHVAFQGYYVCQPASEFTVVDQPWIGSISGYSEEEERGFREFLRKKYVSLAALNAAWKSAFADWDGIRSPKPAFRLGATPDLSAPWVDFSRWKQDAADAWYVKLLTGIRAFDRERVTVAYGQPKLAYAGLLDYAHNGGNARMDMRGELVEACEKGNVGWITEPIHPHMWAADHDPGAEGWTLDASVWSMLSQAGSKGANLHLYSYMDVGERAHIGPFFAQDRMRRYETLLEEIHGARLIRPECEIATYSGWDTLLTKHRAYFGHRLTDLRRWLELVEADGYRASKLEKFPDRPFRLVLPNALDEVIPATAYSNLVRQVKDFGATCLMTARTGRYVTEFGTGDEFPLLRAFGIAPPKGTWKTDGEGLHDGVRFQTLDLLRRETHDERILKDFNRYPYRWIPETDYFGYYPEMPAATTNACGKGWVIVYWGLPSQSEGRLAGLVARTAAFAGVKPTTAEIGDRFEMHDDPSGRHYGFFYRERQYGVKRMVFPNCPDGLYFADDMVSGFRYGLVTGQTLRDRGISAEWRHGESPLKAIRLIPSARSSWLKSYN